MRFPVVMSQDGGRAQVHIQSPDEFIEEFTNSSRGSKIVLAKKVIDDREIAYECRLHNHIGELEYLFGRVADLEEEIRGYKNEQK